MLTETSKHARLTIAVPTFGRTPFLSSTLSSISEQTSPTACIVADGGSDFDFDNSCWAWVKRIELRPDPGIVRCWWSAATASDTEFVAFLADDNILNERYCEEMLSILDQNPECDVVFCNQQWIDSNGFSLDGALSRLQERQFGRDMLPEGVLTNANLNYSVRQNLFPLEACVIRKTVFERCGPARPEAAGALDLDLFLRLIRLGARFMFLPKTLMSFRVHDLSYTAQRQTEHREGLLWVLQNNKGLSLSLDALVDEQYINFLTRRLRDPLCWRKKALIIRSALGKTGGLKAILKNIIAACLGRH